MGELLSDLINIFKFTDKKELFKLSSDNKYDDLCHEIFINNLDLHYSTLDGSCYPEFEDIYIQYYAYDTD